MTEKHKKLKGYTFFRRISGNSQMLVNDYKDFARRNEVKLIAVSDSDAFDIYIPNKPK